jgi:hypothetical protein
VCARTESERIAKIRVLLLLLVLLLYYDDDEEEEQCVSPLDAMIETMITHDFSGNQGTANSRVAVIDESHNHTQKRQWRKTESHFWFQRIKFTVPG